MVGNATAERYLKSKVIYERLVAEGWDVPDNALNDSWETEQIRGPRSLGRDGGCTETGDLCGLIPAS